MRTLQTNETISVIDEQIESEELNFEQNQEFNNLVDLSISS